MKKLSVCCFICWLALLGCTKPVSNSAKEALTAKAKKQELTAIARVLQTQQEAWNRADIDAYMQGYWQSDSLTFVGKSGLTYGWNKTLSNYRKSFPDAAAMGRLNFTILKTELLSPAQAYTIGKWHVTRSGGNIQGHFTLLWKKLNGNWVIVSDHST